MADLIGDRDGSSVSLFVELHKQSVIVPVRVLEKQHCNPGLGAVTCPDMRRSSEARAKLEEEFRKACRLPKTKHPYIHPLTWHAGILRIVPGCVMNGQHGGWDYEAATFHRELANAIRLMNLRCVVCMPHYPCGMANDSCMTEKEFLENYVEAMKIVDRDFPEVLFLERIHLERRLLIRNPEELVLVGNQFRTFDAPTEDLEQFLLNR